MIATQCNAPQGRASVGAAGLAGHACACSLRACALHLAYAVEASPC